MQIHVSQTPCFDVHILWYGLYLLVPRTNILNVFIVGALRVVSGRRSQARVVEDKKESYLEVRRLYMGLNGSARLRLYVAGGGCGSRLAK